ncbi:CAP domain-containing protein [Spirilliplanes yamanashiensis]|nr:CAP domain-containing protein [Spirilliplanes yamanashiensis]MDP9816425.1 uncharacterized protein YkwD [Spirilliplanes yamanashiensis]
MRRSALISGAAAVAALGATVAAAAGALAGTDPGYEAEAASNTLRGSAHIAACEPCSGGTRVGGVGLTGRLTFRGVQAERAGRTAVQIVYSSPDARTALVRANQDGPVLRLAFPATGDAERTATLTVQLHLRAGENTVTFGNPAGSAPDFDRLALGASDGATPAEAVPEPDPVTTAAPPAAAAPTATAPVTAPPTTATPAPSTTPASAPASAPAPATSPTATLPATAPPDAAPPGQPAAAVPPAESGPFASEEAEVTRLVNEERERAGLDPVTAERRLTTAARQHSQDMARRDYFSHTSRNGTTFGERITRNGYRWRAAAENIAKGQESPAEVMTSWMNSPGHRANILNEDLEEIGVGVARDADGRLVWTQDFGTQF